jgi:hypothetical protein
MRDPKHEKKAKKELRKLIRSLTIDTWMKSYFIFEKVTTRKVLRDGTVVSFSVTAPPRPRKEPTKLPTKAKTKAKTIRAKTVKENHAPELRPG